MRIVPNTGADRVVDLAWPWLQASHRIDLASEALSHFAFGELAGNLARTTGVRLVLPPDNTELDLLGSAADRAARNRLLGRWLAGRFAAWIEKTAEVRRVVSPTCLFPSFRPSVNVPGSAYLLLRLSALECLNSLADCLT